MAGDSPRYGSLDHNITMEYVCRCLYAAFPFYMIGAGRHTSAVIALAAPALFVFCSAAMTL